MRKQRGFTLIELLVVVTIIALLIAILLPALGKARDRAKIAACASNMKQSTLGEALYATDWQTWMTSEYYRGYANYQQGTGGPPANTNTTGQMYLYFNFGGGTNPDIPCHFAPLLVTGLVSDGRCFFDPGRIPNDTFDATAPGPVANYGSLEKMTYHSHLSYYYQLHSDLNWTDKAIGGSPSGTAAVAHGPSVPADPSLNTPGVLFIGAAYPKTVNFPPNLFLATCIIQKSKLNPHNSGIGINASFIDGHVENIVTNKVAPPLFPTGTFGGSDTESSQLTAIFEQQSEKNK